MRRRSATGDEGGEAAPPAVAGTIVAGPAGAAMLARVVPHWPQNLTPGVFAAPQFGQVTANAVPHSPQNFRPGSLAVPQFGQITGGRYQPANSVGRRRMTRARGHVSETMQLGCINDGGVVWLRGAVVGLRGAIARRVASSIDSCQ